MNETKGEEARWRVSQAQGTNQPGGAKKTKREKGEKNRGESVRKEQKSQEAKKPGGETAKGRTSHNSSTSHTVSRSRRHILTAVRGVFNRITFQPAEH